MRLHQHRVEGDAPALLLLHGTGSTGAMWRPTAEAFSGHRQLIPDLPGAGRSPPVRAPTPWTLEDDLAALRPLLDEHERWWVVGHSYGGTLALHLALEDARITRVLAHEPVIWSVVKAFGSPDDQAEIDAALADVLAQHEHGGEEAAWLRLFVDFWNGPGAWDALAPRSRQRLARVGHKARCEVVDLLTLQTPRERWASLSAPTRLTVGRASPPAERRALALLAEHVPGVELVEVEGGHLAPASHAQHWGAVARAWIEEGD